ncbi:hypothetical protein ABIC16_003713 [Sphingomonas sp. PvP055]
MRTVRFTARHNAQPALGPRGIGHWRRPSALSSRRGYMSGPCYRSEPRPQPPPLWHSHTPLQQRWQSGTASHQLSPTDRTIGAHSPPSRLQRAPPPGLNRYGRSVTDHSPPAASSSRLTRPSLTIPQTPPRRGLWVHGLVNRNQRWARCARRPNVTLRDRPAPVSPGMSQLAPGCIAPAPTNGTRPLRFNSSKRPATAAPSRKWQCLSNGSPIPKAGSISIFW